MCTPCGSASRTSAAVGQVVFSASMSSTRRREWSCLNPCKQVSHLSLSSLLSPPTVCEETGGTPGTPQNVVSSPGREARVAETQHGRWHHSPHDDVGGRDHA